jgi:hypothetical protein
VQHTCAEPEEIDPETGQLPRTPPPSGQTTGVPCEYDHQCVGVAPEGGPPFVCRDGACAYDCYEDVDCTPNEICTPNDSDITTPGECVPGGDTGVVHCVPGAQVQCDCLAGGTGVQVCKPDGSGYDFCRNGGSGGGGSGGAGGGC